MAVPLVALLALSAAACSDAGAQQPAPAEQRGISVQGEATVSVPPDIAMVSVGVEARADTVAQARDEAATSMNAVRDAVLAAGVAEADLQTRTFQVRPEHDYGPDREPEIIGYVVTNMVEVTVRDIDATSSIVDEAIAAGGDAARVHGISFTVDDPEAHLHDARADAVQHARERAEALASAANVSLGDVKWISEDSAPSPHRPMPVPEADVAADEPTPIDPGEQELTLRVSVIYDIE